MKMKELKGVDFMGSLTRLENIFKELDVFFQEVIDEHLDPKREKVTIEEEDVVDVLLELKKQGHLSIHLTNNHIKAIIMDILVAATDTSAATSVWAMTGLMKNPRVMKKAQQEIRNLYGKKDFLNEEDIEKLVYLKAVIKEALRFFAPAPLVPRETNKTITIEGHKIPPKTLVYVNVWAIQRDPESWNDPEEFYPERFLNNDIDFKGQNFELIPFGAGRRICPGIPLGIATVEIIVANLVNSFDWEMPEGMKREDIDTEGYVYNDVIRLDDAAKLIDCTSVQVNHLIRTTGSLSGYLFECNYMPLFDSGFDDGLMTLDSVLEPSGSARTSSRSSGYGGVDCRTTLACTATTEIVRRKRTNSRPPCSPVTEISVGLINRRKGVPQRAPLY
ncbi:hypothetical protein TanjilG_24897 [Lupinus angustifolius]|uniref:Cytochrome P450 n=1 Tax=Lupinus angustifolius TaxID=3871 RepID=A0A4P1QZV0_LUPAN|nr:hypothetical protein TanjilG_24897 [Lupinus angustifolius]